MRVITVTFFMIFLMTTELYGEEEIEAVSPLSPHGQREVTELITLVRRQREYWEFSLMCRDIAAPGHTR